MPIENKETKAENKPNQCQGFGSLARDRIKKSATNMKRSQLENIFLPGNF